MTNSLTISHRHGVYPILIGRDLINPTLKWGDYINGQRVLIVTNETLAPLYLDQLQTALAAFDTEHLILPDGEQFKTTDTWLHIIDTLATQNYHRDATLIALGGGVIGDMTGFAAACYHRGIGFVQVPTSLLAQVDASIGGKTAVNHPAGKNLIGAFHQPNAVIIDIDTLNTLPEREYRAGLAEVVKAALIRDSDFFTYLETHIDAMLNRDHETVITFIKRACEIKRDIVIADEREQGERALLNLGHTFGHAIEQQLGYGQWLHGEAVALGTLMAATLSVEIGWLQPQAKERIASVLTELQLPARLPPDMKYDKLLAAMWSDKKILNGQLRFILLKDIGTAKITTDVTQQSLIDLLQQFTC